MFRYALVLIAFALCVASAQAGDLKSPFELESTKVLPKKVRNPRFKNLFMDVADKYNGIGNAEPLGQRLNKIIRWGDIVEAQSTPEDRAMVQGFLPANGIDPSGTPGNSTGDVKTFANVKVPVLAMGVTERFTIGVAAPIMKVEVKTDTGFTKSSDGQRFVTEMCVSNPVKCNEAAVKLADPVNQKLRRLGYKPIQSETFSGLGDMKVVGKYVLGQQRDTSLALKSELTLPTGRAPDENRALDVPLGDGQADLGMTLVADQKLSRVLRLNAYTGYTVQFADTITKRIPSKKDDILSDVKENLDRNLGDIVSAGTSLTYEFTSGFSLGAGYSFQYLNSTSYKNGQYEDWKYRLLEHEAPLQSIHSGTVVGGYSTVDMYKAGKFVLPMQANLAYSQPIVGRNVTTNSVIAAELVLFF